MKTLSITFVGNTISEIHVKGSLVEKERNITLNAIQAIRKGELRVAYVAVVPSFMNLLIKEAYKNGYHVIIHNMDRDFKDMRLQCNMKNLMDIILLDYRDIISSLLNTLVIYPLFV